jgi:hypothetical protein
MDRAFARSKVVPKTAGRVAATGASWRKHPDFSMNQANLIDMLLGDNYIIREELRGELETHT